MTMLRTNAQETVRSVDERDEVFDLRETPAKNMLAGRQHIEFLK
jgi:hypothetical protein